MILNYEYFEQVFELIEFEGHVKGAAVEKCSQTALANLYVHVCVSFLLLGVKYVALTVHEAVQL